MSEHPDDPTLARWLETERPARVGRHLEECEVCLARLDALSDLGVLRHHLDTASAPPSDLGDRTRGGVRERLAAEEAAATFFELFTLPWRVAGAILDPEPLQGGTRTTDESDDEQERRDG